MSAVDAIAPSARAAAVDVARRRQTVVIGGILFALAAVVAGVFGWQADGVARFRLTAVGGISVPDLIVPAGPYAYLIAAILAFFGARMFMRGAARWMGLLFGIGLFLTVTAFLAWATAGQSFSLVGMLQATVIRAVPIALGALSGVLCERVAVVNIAIEGMLLAGAFTGTVAGSVAAAGLGGTAGSVVGLLAAIAVGGLLGLLLAVLVVTYRVDQIIAGVAINLLILGLTSYVSGQVLSKITWLNNAPVFDAVEVPLLSQIPIIGPVLFDQNIFVYGAYILVALATYYLFYTRTGLRARAVGEHPEAADTVGINVFTVRYVNVIIGGMVAGFGGAYFTLGSVGRFDENISGGRGFIGLAAMIFGRWHPVGALLAALVFGFADSLQQKLAILQIAIPSEFLAMAPYLVTIILVAGVVGRARAPAADGKPYVKD